MVVLARAFFAGILPEEEPRKRLAAILGVSERNDFALLEQIGGECAGAVSLLPEGVAPPAAGGARLRELSDGELQTIVTELPDRLLMEGEDGLRLSLAGALQEDSRNAARPCDARRGQRRHGSARCRTRARPGFGDVAQSEGVGNKPGVARRPRVAEPSACTDNRCCDILISNEQRRVFAARSGDEGTVPGAGASVGGSMP